MNQYKQHKWMMIQPLGLKLPTFNLEKNSAKNPLRIQIYGQISITGHLDAHLDAHFDHVFLTENRFSGKQR